MSTSSVTPDQSVLASAVTAQAPPAQPAPAYTPTQPSALSGGVASGPDDADSQPQPQSRLAAILGAVARTVSTGLSGVPAGGRPSFLGGLGQGARAEQQAQAAQQEIKFKSFDDAVRAANLHNQDLQKQAADDAQQKAQQAAEDFQNEALGDKGGSMETHPNDGTAVLQTMRAQTAANGAASIAPGTHISADGKNINVPANTPETLAAQVQNYKALEGKLPGLPGLPTFDPSSVKSTQDVVNARAELGKHLDIMQHLLQGYKPDGSVYTHQELNNMIPAYQAQIDSLTKNGGASDYQIGTLKNTLAILQANEQHHSDTEDAVAAKAIANKAQGSQADEQGKINAQMSPEGRALAASNEKLKEQAQDNAAADRPTKPGATDWNPGVGADEKKKAELAENIAFNANEVAKIVMKRPDILGSVAGRYTNAEQMMGNNDPDISALGVHIHNMAMANSGVHGFRSQEGVQSYENQLLNNFKNGPAAMAGALRASTGSVQTFIDNARPEAYKTHSKQGGAVRGMMGVQQ